MSIIDSYSLGYRIQKMGEKKFPRKKTSRINMDISFDNKSSYKNESRPNYYSKNNLQELSRNKTDIVRKMASIKILEQLAYLGYKIDSIMALNQQYKFNTVEEALDLLERDPETKLYNHYFCPFNYQFNNKKCRICGNTFEEHKKYDDSENELLGYTKEVENFEENTFEQNCNKDKNEEIKIKKLINDNSNFAKSIQLKKKSNFSPENKLKKIPKNNNSSSLLILSNNSQTKNYIDNLNKTIYKKKTIIEKPTINNISINIQNKLLRGNSININKPILIRINTISNNKKSKSSNKNDNTKKNEKPSQNPTQINKTEKKNSIKLPTYCKVEIPDEVIKSYQNPKLCNICYNNEINPNNPAQKHCKYKFCDECINSYLTGKIVNGEVLNIKCIMVGCPHIYTHEEIKENISSENYLKYKKFERIQNKLKNPQKKYVNCPYINCEELVECTNINEGNLICEKGHMFCRKCFKIGGHPNSKCTKEDINNSFFKELKKYNTKGMITKLKQCPECHILIEKVDGCNEMKCSNCGFVFCWLCLREYSPNHFSMYNTNGCPGMRFENERTYKIRNNPCLNCLWHFLSCLLGICMFIIIYLFYFFCGCPYEFVKCYKNKKNQNDNESIYENYDEHSLNMYNRNIYITVERNRNNIYNTNNISRPNKLNKNQKYNKLIIGLLIFAGICCQPIYITFYVLYAVIECYKRINCLFYFPD